MSELRIGHGNSIHNIIPLLKKKENVYIYIYACVCMCGISGGKY